MSSSMDPHLPNHRKQYPFNGRQIASRVVTLPVCESPVCEPPARQASTVPENRLDAGSPTQVLPKTTSRVRDRLQTQAKVSRAIYIKFLGLPAQDLRVRDVWTLCSRFGNVAVSDLVNTVSGQVAIVGWFDHRNAVQAIEALSKMDHLYQCDFIFDCHLDSYGDISNLSALSNSAASVFCLPVRGDIPPSSLRAELEQFGEVEHLCEVPHFPAVHLCRYYNILSALNILTKAETIKTTLIVTSDMIGLLENYAFKDYMMFRHSSVQSTGRYQKSKWKTIASWLPKMHTAEINSQAWAVGNENTASSTSQRNEVSVGRVLLGQDNRNTIMIKNIPNNYHRDDLKSYLDVTNKGTYDFLYLRMDYANQCNVGYAFVSFMDPKSIITLLKARVGKKWDHSSSEKRFTIVYANIQGKENLIRKFRTSKVMQHEDIFRPMVFYSDGLRQGEEQNIMSSGTDM